MNESEVPDEWEENFQEDQELEQIIEGKICFKVFPFSKGMFYVKPWGGLHILSDMPFIFLWFIVMEIFCRNTFSKRRKKNNTSWFI